MTVSPQMTETTANRGPPERERIDASDRAASARIQPMSGSPAPFVGLVGQNRATWSCTRNKAAHCVQLARPNTYVSASATAVC